MRGTAYNSLGRRVLAILLCLVMGLSMTGLSQRSDDAQKEGAALSEDYYDENSDARSSEEGEDTPTDVPPAEETQTPDGEMQTPSDTAGDGEEELTDAALTKDTAEAEDGSVEYWYCDENGQNGEIRTLDEEYTPVTAGDSDWYGGWYVVEGEVTISDRIKVIGAVRLILTDGCHLVAEQGITVAGINSLTIYGQQERYAVPSEERDYQLVAQGGENQAGIGGDETGSTSLGNGNYITINGGTVKATGGSSGAGIGGGAGCTGSSITINSGVVTATGAANGAGIGGGNNGAGSSITVNGGIVTATGGSSGAGIGGGSDKPGSNITINGGKVTAEGGNNAAGIGGGSGNTGTVIINGGDVTATGAGIAAGIGGGSGQPGTVTISGGVVTATGAGNGVGIGAGNRIGAGTVTISGGNVTAKGGSTNAGGIGGSAASKVTISGNAVVTAASGGSGAAISKAPTFGDDYIHLTYANENTNDATDTAKEWTGNSSTTWSWKWVKIQPMEVEGLVVTPDETSVTLDGSNPATVPLKAELIVTVGEKTERLDVTSGVTTPATWTVTGSQDGPTIANGTLTVSAAEHASELKVTAAYTADKTYTSEEATVTIKQPKFTVTFNYLDNGDNPKTETVTVERYKTVSAPDTSSHMAGFTAVWYTDENCTDEYDFDSEVTDDITLYAKWEKITITGITLSSNSLELTYGGEGTALTATVMPEVALQDVSWSYSDCISIEEQGNTVIITPVKAGNGVITATSEHNTAVSAACEITVKPASIAGAKVAVDGTYTYNGSDQSSDITRNVTVTLGGKTLQAGTDYTVTYGGAVIDAATYTVTVTGTGNYEGAAKGSVTVEKKALIPVVNTVESKEYNGKTDAEGTVRLTGAAAGDAPTASGTFSFVDKNAGENKPVNVTDIKLVTGAANYTLSVDSLENQSTNAAITPLEAQFVWVEEVSFTYDGEVHTVSARVSNAVTGDEEEFDLTYDGNAASDAGDYTASVSDLGNGNYVLPDNAERRQKAWSIAKADSTVTLEEKGAANATYGETVTIVAVIGSSDAGEGDTRSVSTVNADKDYVQFFINHKSVGCELVTYKTNAKDSGTATLTIPATATNYFNAGSNVVTAEYGGSKNLLNAGSAALTVVIEKKELDAAIKGTSTSKEYDGTNAASGLSIELGGVLDNDDVTATATYAYNSANVLDAKTISAEGITLSGEHAGNYTVKTPAAINGTITAKEVGLSWSGYENLTYTGEPVSVTAKATGLLYDDVCTVTVEGGNATDAGEHTAKATGLSNSNYKLPGNAELTYKIEKAVHPAPVGRIKVIKTSNSITVTSHAGEEFEYSIDGENWSGKLEKLTPETAYTVYVRYKGTDNYWPSDSITKNVTTTAKNGTTTLQPGETVQTKDASVTNDGDKVVIEPDDGGESIIVISETSVEMDADGNVTVSAHASVQTDDGEEMTLPQGGTVSSGGKVTADEIVVGDTTVKGDGVTADKDGNITASEGSTVKTNGGEEMTLPQGGKVDADGNVTADEIRVGKTTVKGDDATADKDGNMTVSKGSTVKTNGGEEMTLPQGGTVDTNGNVTADEIVVGDTTVKGKDLTADADGNVSVSNGGTVKTGKGQEMTLPQGGTADAEGNVTADEIVVGKTTVRGDDMTADKDGNVTFPNGGEMEIGNTTVTIPRGETVTPNPKGTDTDIPGGSTVKPGNGGAEITVGEQGGAVDSDGNVTLPGGGSARVGSATVTVPENGGTLQPNKDGTVTIPGGSIVLEGVGEVPVPKKGAIYDPVKDWLTPVSGKAGSVKVNAQIGDGAPEADISTGDELLEDAVLTLLEKQMLELGYDAVEIILSVKDATETASDDAKRAMEIGTDGYAIGQYLDLALMKIVDNGTITAQPITETSTPIEIVFTIPQALLDESHVFALARLHAGEVTLLPDLDSDAKTLTIETDRFSTYAIVYRQATTAETPGNSPAGGKNPATGDDAILWPWLMLMTMTLGGLGVIAVSGRRGRKE